MKLADFNGATAPLVVDVNGIPVNCEVKLNAITSRFLLEVQNDVNVTAGAKLVEKSLGKWDVTDEKENVLPITLENLLDVPTSFITNYLDGVKNLKKQK